MISKNLAIEVLNEALSTGGDYAEIYLEEKITEGVSLENGSVETSSNLDGFGCGIRILNGFLSVYGYTCNINRKSLLDLARKLSKRFNEKRKIEVKDLETVHVKKVNKISEHLKDVPITEKVSYCREISKIIQNVINRHLAKSVSPSFLLAIV